MGKPGWATLRGLEFIRDRDEARQPKGRSGITRRTDICSGLNICSVPVLCPVFWAGWSLSWWSIYLNLEDKIGEGRRWTSWEYNRNSHANLKANSESSHNRWRSVAREMVKERWLLERVQKGKTRKGWVCRKTWLSWGLEARILRGRRCKFFRFWKLVEIKLKNSWFAPEAP